VCDFAVAGKIFPTSRSKIDVTSQKANGGKQLKTIGWVIVLSLVAAGSYAAQRGDVRVRLARDADTKGPLPVLRDGKWGYIDHTGSIAITPQFEEAGFFYEGRAAVRQNGLWGYVDGVGSVVIQPTFSLASRFSNGLAYVRRGTPGDKTSTSAYINPSGQVVFECTGTRADVRLSSARCGRQFYEGFVAEAIEVFRCVDDAGRPIDKEYPCKALLIDSWGYYDKSGALTIRGPFHSGLSRFSGGLAAVQPYGQKLMGFINSAGTFVVPPKFERAEAFSDGLAAVKNGGLWGFIDSTGKQVVEPRFQSASAFSEGRAVVGLGGGVWGYIDKSGAMVIPPRFKDTGPFSEGLAPVCCEDGKTVYIDSSGRLAFQPPPISGFTGAGRFVDGVALIEKPDGGSAYIDRRGRVLAVVR